MTWHVHARIVSQGTLFFLEVFMASMHARKDGATCLLTVWTCSQATTNTLSLMKKDALIKQVLLLCACACACVCASPIDISLTGIFAYR